MNLRFTLLGFEVAKIQFDHDREFSPEAKKLVTITPPQSPRTRLIKKVSSLWVEAMTK